MRDVDRAKVYAAEQLVRRTLDRSAASPMVELHGSTLVLEQERRFSDLAAVQSYVAAVQAMSWYPPNVAPISVRRRKGDRKAHYNRERNEIALHTTERVDGNWGLRELVVLHEMAHAASTQTHGRAFRTAFVAHVREVIGPAVGFLLETVLAEECGPSNLSYR